MMPMISQFIHGVCSRGFSSPTGIMLENLSNFAALAYRLPH
jgi:hypothetical protein